MKLVVVDDEPVALLIMSKIIKRIGEDIEVVTFTDGRQAIGYLDKHQPCLVFMDLNMPDLSGWDVLDRLEANNCVQNVVVLTSSVSPQDRERAMNYDYVKGFVVKPASKDQLIRYLQQFGRVRQSL